MEQQSTENLFFKKNYYTSIMKSLRPPGSPNIRTSKSGLLNGTTNGFHNRLDPAIPDVGPWDGGPYVGLVTSPSACFCPSTVFFTWRRYWNSKYQGNNETTTWNPKQPLKNGCLVKQPFPM